MKKFLIVCLSIISVFTIYAFNVSYDTNYTVIETIESVEIREYPESIFASYYTNGSGNNSQFRVLANYIFGGNDRQEQIGMTSPVNMKISSENNEMLFLMPNRYNKINLPKPNNINIDIITVEKRKVATLRFSGYSNTDKVNKKKAQLIETLNKHNIKHTNEYELLIYDSPYKLLNRRNEVLVVLP
ncbi:MAG: SOUL family heme-binding protein [Flavobacteriales bacterium]